MLFRRVMQWIGQCTTHAKREDYGCCEKAQGRPQEEGRQAHCQEGEEVTAERHDLR
jgi:hypothetical protein